ncbi:MAG: HIT-like protein [bacterium ADurb.Bin400]|nr:MAG: HIT-like protein [bacterium ADurb.Bin400]
MNESCIFCQIAQKKVAANIVYEDESFIAFHDINPQAPVHILIITKRHIPSAANLTDNDSDLIGQMVLRANSIAQEIGLDNNYRLVINVGKDAGQTVFHLHMHIIGGQVLGRIA